MQSTHLQQKPDLLTCYEQTGKIRSAREAAISPISCGSGVPGGRGGARCEPSGMDNPRLLGDNFAQTMRHAPRLRRLNEFDPEYTR